MNKFLYLIKKYNLEDYLKIILTKNTGNTNPYHNFYHIQTVVISCYTIAKFENVKDDEIKLILIAALFHDFDHSGGKLTDDKNVKIAIENFLTYSKESKKNNDIIVDLISITEFPYDDTKDSNLTLNQKIIRDADISQLTKDNVFQQVIIGLEQELNNDLKDQIKIQIKFMDSLEYFTEYGKHIYHLN